jgi:hypothetical protein
MEVTQQRLVGRLSHSSHTNRVGGGRVTEGVSSMSGMHECCRCDRSETASGMPAVQCWKTAQ